MKVAQLIEGKTYVNKKGVKRHLRQLTGSTGAHYPNRAFYLEEGDNCIRDIPAQEFATWAKSTTEPFKKNY